MTEKKERIAKVMADAGLCSRREAERWITAGRVSVNGQVLATPACVVGAADKIVVDGKEIGKKQDRRLWAYHKPAGLITTHADPKGRTTVFEKLPKYLPRVISVGRLDYNTEGLLLLTTDGALARELELPSRGWSRKYRVRVHGSITPDIIAKLSKGIEIEGIKYAPAILEIERVQGTNTWALMTLKEGKNREIRRLMEYFNLPVTRLIRISYGPFQLGNLEVGAVREVTQKALGEVL
ncbi:MAG: rRNA pseudouridine synthase [Lactobacillales bacterium]|jgi:23S rRNA pseudouridine2605 synthase|nr:rRNA pseudouridine synthase [Lactobacillales bacterium]